MLGEIREAIKSYYEVYFAISAIYEKLAKIHGLTSSSLFVLYMLYEYQGQCTQHFICEKLLYPKQTVNTILAAFANKGYISKAVAPADKRNKQIFLTETGKQYAGLVLAAMLHMEEVSFANMDAAKRNAMLNGERAFLQQLTQSLHSLEQAAGSSQAVLPQPDKGEERK